jgi:hypothetical protein
MAAIATASVSWNSLQSLRERGSATDLSMAIVMEIGHLEGIRFYCAMLIPLLTVEYTRKRPEFAATMIQEIETDQRQTLFTEDSISVYDLNHCGIWHRGGISEPIGIYAQERRRISVMVWRASSRKSFRVWGVTHERRHYP